MWPQEEPLQRPREYTCQPHARAHGILRAMPSPLDILSEIPRSIQILCIMDWVGEGLWRICKLGVFFFILIGLCFWKL